MNNPPVVYLTSDEIAKMLVGTWKVPCFIDGKETYSFHGSRRAAERFAIAHQIDCSKIEPPMGVDQ